MNKPKSFILKNFNAKEIFQIVSYIKEKYKKNSLIYASIGFCCKMADNVLGTISDDTLYESLTENKMTEVGLIGVFKGTPIICTPELNKINAIIVPDWSNFYHYYFKKENK